MTKKLDYVIAQTKGQTKPFLMQVVQLESDYTVVGMLENNRRTKAQTVMVKPKEILLNLGPNPMPGKVYNIDVSNLYRKSFNHDWWGAVHFYTKLDAAVVKLLRNGLDRTAEILEKHKLAPFVEVFETEIRAKKGKYAGMYVHRPKDNASVVWYAPEWTAGDSKAMDYVILHEFGHVVRFNGLKGAVKLRQKWLRLYQESIKPVVVPAKAHAHLWTALSTAHNNDAELPFGEALKDLSAEDEKNHRALKVILKWIKQVHKVGPKELSLAWSAGDMKYLKSVWPESAIDSSDLTPVISEYATKNMEELFAECFAMYMSKIKLPEAYVDLMEKSLSYAKATIGSEVNE